MLLETGHLRSGIYFVELRDGEGRFNREKLLVLH